MARPFLTEEQKLASIARRKAKQKERDELRRETYAARRKELDSDPERIKRKLALEKARLEDPFKRARRNARHKVYNTRPEHRKRVGAQRMERYRADADYREAILKRRRFKASGLPWELFEIQDLTKKIKSRINELRRPEKDALCGAPKA
jgi:hypothetical protein